MLILFLLPLASHNHVIKVNVSLDRLRTSGARQDGARGRVGQDAEGAGIRPGGAVETRYIGIRLREDEKADGDGLRT